MTLATEIAKLGSYNSTDITNCVSEGLDLISLYYGSTYTEDTDEDWDRIAKVQIIHLLDRLAIQRRALSDTTVSVPPLISPEIHSLIKRLEVEQAAPTSQVIATFDHDQTSLGTFSNPDWS